MNGSVGHLAREAIRKLKAYSSARSLTTEGSIFLDANECPWSPETGSRVNRYPEPQPRSLTARLAALYEVSPECLMVGRGTDDAIDVLVRTFCEAGKDKILICPPTYGVYEVAANIQGAPIVKVMTRAENDFAPDAKEILSAWTPEVKLIFLCSPNNPTGNVVAPSTVETLCRELRGRAVLVLDEAYIEFSQAPSFAPRVAEFGNLVVLRTLSKAWGLAGARCGSAVASPEIISLLHKVRAPYPLTQPSTEVVLCALDGIGLKACQDRVRRLNEGRKELVRELSGLPFVRKVFPSEANFVLVQVEDSAWLMKQAREKGIILRDRSSEPGLQNCVRISIGSEEEMAKLTRVLREASRAS